VTLIALKIALVACLLLLSSVFSGSETALFSLKPYQLRKIESKPSRRALRVASLLKDPQHLLVALLIGNTLVNVAATSIGTDLVGGFVSQAVVGISVAVMTSLILVFGEIVPKTVALNRPVAVSMLNAPLITLAVRVLTPGKPILEKIVKAAARLVSRWVPQSTPAEEHVREALALGHLEGILDRFERDVLGGVFGLMHLSVQNIMTPRTEVFMLSSDVSVRDATRSVKAAGYSRIPVFRADSRDEIVGVLYAKDLLFKQYTPGLTVGEIARDPLFIPESKPLVDLLGQFASGAAHFAAVIDEYGSFSGVVTLDDILSEIVGRDFSRPLDKHSHRRIGRSVWEVSGRMEIEYFNALTGSPLPETDAETVAGFVIEKLGRIPAVGEELASGGFRFRVLGCDRMRIKSLRVEKARK
jgi:CBS domain containing-hemolysin-like protein